MSICFTLLICSIVYCSVSIVVTLMVRFFHSFRLLSVDGDIWKRKSPKTTKKKFWIIFFTGKNILSVRICEIFLFNQGNIFVLFSAGGNSGLEVEKYVKSRSKCILTEAKNTTQVVRNLNSKNSWNFTTGSSSKLLQVQSPPFPRSSWTMDFWLII